MLNQKFILRHWLSLFLSVAIFFASPVFHHVDVLASTPVLSFPLSMPSQVPVDLMMKGLSIHPEDPLRYDFIFDAGGQTVMESALETKVKPLVQDFITALALPAEDMWVNLSPYEYDRVIDKDFGQTQMGLDLLEQDYRLKQLASMILHPENPVGQSFWTRVYQALQSRYESTDLPINMTNRFWIVPQQAEVMAYQQMVFVGDVRFKVLTEADYLAVDTTVSDRSQSNMDDIIYNEMLRSIIIPEIEREVNEGDQFVRLRQITHALLLALWYKRNLKGHLLNQTFSDQKRIMDSDKYDASISQQWHQNYVTNYQQGVFHHVQDQYDPLNQKMITQSYFSGGVPAIHYQDTSHLNSSQQRNSIKSFLEKNTHLFVISVFLSFVSSMTSTPVASVQDHPLKSKEENIAIVESYQPRADLYKQTLTSAEIPFIVLESQHGQSEDFVQTVDQKFGEIVKSDKNDWAVQYKAQSMRDLVQPGGGPLTKFQILDRVIQTLEAGKEVVIDTGGESIHLKTEWNDYYKHLPLFDAKQMMKWRLWLIMHQPIEREQFERLVLEHSLEKITDRPQDIGMVLALQPQSQNLSAALGEIKSFINDYNTGEANRQSEHPTMVDPQSLAIGGIWRIFNRPLFVFIIAYLAFEFFVGENLKQSIKRSQFGQMIHIAISIGIVVMGLILLSAFFIPKVNIHVLSYFYSDILNNNNEGAHKMTQPNKERFEIDRQRLIQTGESDQTFNSGQKKNVSLKPMRITKTIEVYHFSERKDILEDDAPHRFVRLKFYLEADKDKINTDLFTMSLNGYSILSHSAKNVTPSGVNQIDYDRMASEIIEKAFFNEHPFLDVNIIISQEDNAVDIERRLSEKIEELSNRDFEKFQDLVDRDEIIVAERLMVIGGVFIALFTLALVLIYLYEDSKKIKTDSLLAPSIQGLLAGFTVPMIVQLATALISPRYYLYLTDFIFDDFLRVPSQQTEAIEPGNLSSHVGGIDLAMHSLDMNGWSCESNQSHCHLPIYPMATPQLVNDLASKTLVPQIEAMRIISAQALINF